MFEPQPWNKEKNCFAIAFVWFKDSLKSKEIPNLEEQKLSAILKWLSWRQIFGAGGHADNPVIAPWNL